MKTISLIALILCAVSFAQTNVAHMLSGVNAQTGTSYTFIASDVTKVVTFTNANPVSVTLISGSNPGFGAGSIFTAVNLGAGAVTITCTACTINGGASVQILQNQSVNLYGDGTNYISAMGTASGQNGTSTWNAILTPTGNLSLALGLNTSLFTIGDFGASPVTGAYKITDTASNTSDTTTNFLVNTGASSRHNPVGFQIQGTNEFQVCWQPGPQGQIVVGSAVTCSAINQSPFAKFVVESNTGIHGDIRLYQRSTSATATMLEMNNATASSSAYNFFTACSGASATDTSCPGGNIISKLDGRGFFTAQQVISPIYTGAAGVQLQDGPGTSGVFISGGDVDINDVASNQINLIGGDVGSTVHGTLFLGGTAQGVDLHSSDGNLQLGAFNSTLNAIATLSGTAFTTNVNMVAPTAQWTGITGLTQCLHVNSAGTVSGTGVDCGAGGGGTPGGATLSFQYNNAGSFAGPTVGVNKGFYVFGRQISAHGTPVAPNEFQVGDCVSPGTITGATTSYTVVYTDVINCTIAHDRAASGSATITIPTPTTLDNPTPFFVYSNYSPQSDTLTPTTYTISQGTAAAAATLAVPSGVTCKVQLDPVNASTWKAACSPMSTSVITGATTNKVAKFSGGNLVNSSCSDSGTTLTCADTSVKSVNGVTMYVDQFASSCTPGTNDNACIAAAIAAISGSPGSGGGYGVIDDTGVTGAQKWTASPFAAIISNGTTNFTTPQKCGRLRLNGGSAITMNQPFAVPRCWQVEFISARGEVQNISPSASWPGIYTTGTITNTVASLISTSQYQFTVTGTGTTWTTNVVPGEIFAVCQGANNPGANGTSCGGDGKTTCSVTCGSNAANQLTYGMVIAVTDNTHLIVATANLGHGAANAGAVNYVIYAPLIELGVMGAAGGDAGGVSVQWNGGTLSCANKASCVNVVNFSQQENAHIDDVVLNNSISSYLDVESNAAVNSGPYNNIVINSSGSCVAGTLPIIFRIPGATRPLQNFTLAMNTASCATTSIDWEQQGEIGGNSHHENVSSGNTSNVVVSVGYNTGAVAKVVCPIICVETIQAANGAWIHGLNSTGVGLTGVDIGSATTPEILLSDLNFSQTNAFVDNARGCTQVNTGGDGYIEMYERSQGGAWLGTAGVASNACASSQLGYILTAAMSQQTTATQTAITNMSFPLTASKYYKIVCDIPVTFAASATLAFGFTGSANPSSYNIYFDGNIGAAAAFQRVQLVAATTWVSGATNTGASGAPGAVTSVVHLVADINNSANNQTVTLGTVANGTNGITVLGRSSCQMNQLN